MTQVLSVDDRDLLISGYNRENYKHELPDEISRLMAIFYDDNDFDRLCDINPIHSSPAKAQTLIDQIGGFDALLKYTTNDEQHYTSMLQEIRSQIEMGRNEIHAFAKITDNQETDKIKSKQLSNHSDVLLSVFNQITSKLQNAQNYTHPDHKNVEILKAQIKELNLTMPYIESEELAILNTLPRFLKQELNKLKPRRAPKIRTNDEERTLDKQYNKQKRLNFHQSLQRVKLLQKQIKLKNNQIKNALPQLQKSELQLQQTNDACDEINKYISQLGDEFELAGNYIHPSQSALISIADEYNKLAIKNAELKRLLSLKQGELNAYDEMKLGAINIDTLGQTSIHSTVNRSASLVFFDDDNKDTEFKLNDINYSQINTNTEPIPVDDMEIQNYNSSDLCLNIDAVETKNAYTMEQKLNEIKTKCVCMRFSIKQFINEEFEKQLNDIMNLVDEMLNEKREKSIYESQYVKQLEKRYGESMGLYQMKYAEVEHKADLLYQSNQYINDLKEDISDLDYRLGAVMSSAVSNVKTRMKSFNEMGIKIQTIEKVMKLTNDTYTNIREACEDIQQSVEKDLSDIIGTSFDDKQSQDKKGMIGNVNHACDYIVKAFADIVQEMDGVKQFVHPDREMVEQLQLELIAMYEEKKLTT